MKVLRLFIILFIIATLQGCSAIGAKSASSSQSQSQSQSTKTTSTAQNTQTQTQASADYASPVSSVVFSYIGVDADKLSPVDLKPDGKKDGHFHLTIPINQQIRIKSIWIRYNEFGKWFKWGWIYDKNLSLPCYNMAVYDSQGNQVLPQGDIGYLATPVKGLIDLDLYIPELSNANNRDTFQLAKGETLTLEVDYVMQNNAVGNFYSSTTL